MGGPGANSNRMSADLAVGSAVTLHSLNARPKLNGRGGVIISALDPDKGRYGVKVDVDGAQACQPDRCASGYRRERSSSEFDSTRHPQRMRSSRRWRSRGPRVPCGWARRARQSRRCTVSVSE